MEQSLKLRSSEHDYYDSCVHAIGVDEQDRCYIRKETEFDDYNDPVQNEIRSQIGNLIDSCSRERIPKLGDGSPRFTFSFTDLGIVFFCGKTFPYIPFSVNLCEMIDSFPAYIDYQCHLQGLGFGFKNTRTQVFCYTEEHLRQFFDAHLLDKKQKKWIYGLQQYGLPIFEQFVRWLETHRPELPLDLYRQCDSPIIRVHNFGGDRKYYVLNPILQNLGFQRVVDPWSAAQEIDAFLHTTLIDHPKPMLEISDVIRVQEHGFDKDWSFRRHADEKKPKRRKHRQ